MTDEEKAEEYVIKNVCKSCGLCDKGKYIRCDDYRESKQFYLDGLAEGRKELEQWKQEWQDAQIKANEEGFARTTLQIKYSELEKENLELKAQFEKLKKLIKNCTQFYGDDTELYLIWKGIKMEIEK